MQFTLGHVKNYGFSYCFHKVNFGFWSKNLFFIFIDNHQTLSTSKELFRAQSVQIFLKNKIYYINKKFRLESAYMSYI